MNLTAKLILALVLAFGSGAAQGQTKQAYDVSISGFKVGSLRLNAQENSSSYAVSGAIQGGGLIGAITSFSFSGTAKGGLNGAGSLIPREYASVSKSRGKERAVTMTYQGDTPASLTHAPTRKKRSYDAALSDGKGTLDPVSATYALLQDMPVGQACGRTVQVFDGTKRSRITVRKRERDGEAWRCKGTYTRVKGWRAKDMEEKTNFSFALTFREVDGIMQVTSFETQSLFGKVVARRR